MGFWGFGVAKPGSWEPRNPAVGEKPGIAKPSPAQLGSWEPEKCRCHGVARTSPG